MRFLSLGISTLLFVACAAPTAHRSADRPPNVLLIVADDQGWGELSSKGHPWISTPSLDAMASQGLSFERFYAAAPVCSPTRASLLTGRHPNRTRTFSWGHELPPSEWTLAEALRARGYTTGHFGKWHLGSTRASMSTSPGAQGFDVWVSSPNFFDLDPLLSFNGQVRESRGEGSDVVTEHALAFLDSAAAAQQPFLAVVWYGSPHLPHAATDVDRAEFQHVPEDVRAYCAEFAGIDRGVRRIRRKLRDLAISDQTVVWYTSDNGPHAPGAAADHATAGLRGSKGSLWEGGLRVPSIVEWPGTISAGATWTETAGTVDIFPTVLELAGAPLPENVVLDGVSLSSQLRAPHVREGPTRELGFWSLPVPGRVQHATKILTDQRNGRVSPEEAPPNVDLTLLANGRLPGPAAWIENGMKLHAVPDGTVLRHELYDLERDPAESNDLAPSRPEQTERMREHLLRWQTSVAREALVGLEP